ncbi:unnamed protein product [Vitrella brassicaformis CCMP3155]|uniref:Uncharacterized protein n=1 Tax=Vitrella brassicaformis (strain CCMP3155) TaxID=1169540 RepID=A0A0G4H350_VITBC|nr:unnamed protein product [Vitrella brassicaformis CCMP3155]|eukprot:CEM38134.1 unnamed protein product [Vitrella brassicaformis CCMP3155]
MATLCVVFVSTSRPALRARVDNVRQASSAGVTSVVTQEDTKGAEESAAKAPQRPCTPGSGSCEAVPDKRAASPLLSLFKRPPAETTATKAGAKVNEAAKCVADGQRCQGDLPCCSGTCVGGFGKYSLQRVCASSSRAAKQPPANAQTPKNGEIKGETRVISPIGSRRKYNYTAKREEATVQRASRLTCLANGDSCVAAGHCCSSHCGSKSKTCANDPARDGGWNEILIQ